MSSSKDTADNFNSETRQLPQPQQRSAIFNSFTKDDPQIVMAYKFCRILHNRLVQAIFASNDCISVKDAALPGLIDMLICQSLTHVLPLEILVETYCNRTGAEGIGFKFPKTSSVIYSFSSGRSDEHLCPYLVCALPPATLQLVESVLSTPIHPSAPTSTTRAQTLEFKRSSISDNQIKISAFDSPGNLTCPPPDIGPPPAMPPSPPKFSALLNRLSYSDAPAKNIANAKSLLSLQRAVEIPEDLIPSQSAGKEDKFWKYLLNEHKEMEQAHHDAAMAAHATSIHANNTWETFMQASEARETRISNMTAYNLALAMRPPSQKVTQRERSHEYGLQHPSHDHNLMIIESRVANTQGFLNTSPPSINWLRNTPELTRAVAQLCTNDHRALCALCTYFQVPLDTTLLQRTHETLRRSPPDILEKIIGVRLYAPATCRMLVSPYQHNDQHCDLPHLIKPLSDFKVIFVEHPNSSDRARSFFNAGELLQLVSDIDGMLHCTMA